MKMAPYFLKAKNAELLLRIKKKTNSGNGKNQQIPRKVTHYKSGNRRHISIN